jgi:hypothetical protein
MIAALQQVSHGLEQDRRSFFFSACYDEVADQELILLCRDTGAAMGK